MTPEEKQIVQTAILTISDPKGNWDHGWKTLCELVGLNPSEFVPPFKPHPVVDRSPLTDPRTV